MFSRSYVLWPRSAGRRPPGAQRGGAGLVRLAALDPELPVLLTTGDHALLEPAVIRYLCERAEQSECDVLAGLVRHADVMRACPGAIIPP